MSAWWHGIPPAQAAIACGRERHTLRWRDGELVALDHGDLEGERALAALAGERCTCLEALDAWRRHSDDIRALVLGSRGASDPLAPAGGEAPPGAWASYAPGGSARAARERAFQLRSRLSRVGGSASIGAMHVGQPMRVLPKRGGPPRVAVPNPGLRGFPPPGRGKQAREDELIALLTLGGGLGDRLVFTVASRWRTRLQRGHSAAQSAMPQLRAALDGRARAALRPWLAEDPRRLEVSMIGEDTEATIAQEPDGIEARLPFGWLVDVWAKGIATVAGRFCLQAQSDDGRHWSLLTVSLDLSEPQTLMLRIDRR